MNPPNTSTQPPLISEELASRVRFIETLHGLPLSARMHLLSKESDAEIASLLTVALQEQHFEVASQIKHEVKHRELAAPQAPRADEGTPTLRDFTRPRESMSAFELLDNFSIGTILDALGHTVTTRKIDEAMIELADLRGGKRVLPEEPWHDYATDKFCESDLPVWGYYPDALLGGVRLIDFMGNQMTHWKRAKLDVPKPPVSAARSPLPCADINQSTSDYVLSVEDLPSYSLAPLVGRKEEEKT